MIVLKSQNEIEKMRVAGRITAQILHEMASRVQVGVTPFELDTFAEQRCAELGVTPAFKGYQGFPNSVCISVNDQVVHSVPSRQPLVQGDLLKLDFGVIYQGYHGDSAITMAVGKMRDEHFEFVLTANLALLAGIAQVKPGNRIGDISNAIQRVVENGGFSVVKPLCGHGIGRKLHEAPSVPNYGPAGTGPLLSPGLTIAIEPIINMRGGGFLTEADGWTTRTLDGGVSAHFEHTVLVTQDGCEILTLYAPLSESSNPALP